MAQLYARIINNEVVDISENPYADFHEIVAKTFVEVPETTKVGSIKNPDGSWTVPSEVKKAHPPSLPFVTPVQFKMCFKPSERLLIKELKTVDKLLQDAYEILDDVRLTQVDLSLQSVKDTVYYIKSLGVINEERAKEILSGQVI